MALEFNVHACDTGGPDSEVTSVKKWKRKYNTLKIDPSCFTPVEIYKYTSNEQYLKQLNTVFKLRPNDVNRLLMYNNKQDKNKIYYNGYEYTSSAVAQRMHFECKSKRCKATLLFTILIQSNKTGVYEFRVHTCGDNVTATESCSLNPEIKESVDDKAKDQSGNIIAGTSTILQENTSATKRTIKTSSFKYVPVEFKNYSKFYSLNPLDDHTVVKFFNPIKGRPQEWFYYKGFTYSYIGHELVCTKMLECRAGLKINHNETAVYEDGFHYCNKNNKGNYNCTAKSRKTPTMKPCRARQPTIVNRGNFNVLDRISHVNDNSTHVLPSNRPNSLSNACSYVDMSSEESLGTDEKLQNIHDELVTLNNDRVEISNDTVKSEVKSEFDKDQGILESEVKLEIDDIEIDYTPMQMDVKLETKEEKPSLEIDDVECDNTYMELDIKDEIIEEQVKLINTSTLPAHTHIKFVQSNMQMKQPANMEQPDNMEQLANMEQPSNMEQPANMELRIAKIIANLKKQDALSACEIPVKNFHIANVKGRNGVGSLGYLVNLPKEDHGENFTPIKFKFYENRVTETITLDSNDVDTVAVIHGESKRTLFYFKGHAYNCDNLLSWCINKPECFAALKFNQENSTVLELGVHPPSCLPLTCMSEIPPP